MAQSTLAGLAVLELSLDLALYGPWTARCRLQNSTDGASVGKQAALVLGSLSASAYVYRSAVYASSTTAYLVGGKGGWGRELPAKPYVVPGAVKLKTVLGDAAKEAGEDLVLSLPDRTVGSFYMRQKGPASYVLKRLAPTWWCRYDGKTEVGARAADVVVSKFDVMDYDPALGKVTIASESPEDWLPGRMFSSPLLPGGALSISAVSHRLSTERLRTIVWIK